MKSLIALMLLLAGLGLQQAAHADDAAWTPREDKMIGGSPVVHSIIPPAVVDLTGCIHGTVRDHGSRIEWGTSVRVSDPRTGAFAICRGVPA